MKVSLASCAELYAEHRRTASPRKRAKIAAELQRRHDEWNCGHYIWSGHYIWRFYDGRRMEGRFPNRRLVDTWFDALAFDFAVWLP